MRRTEALSDACGWPTSTIPDPAGRAPRTSGSCSTATGAGPARTAFETVDGHQAGADKIKDLLEWCEEAGVEVVTLWLLSTDNLGRAEKEIVPLLKIIETAVADLAIEGRWRLHPIGALDLLPAGDRRSRSRRRPRRTRDDRRAARQRRRRLRRPTRDRRRRAVADPRARRRTATPVEQIADGLTVEDIAQHLYTKGQPDPDLVIRTSGEQRLGGFLLWQSAQVGVLLLRGVLAGLPARRLPARAPRVCRPAAPLRPLRPAGRPAGIPRVSGGSNLSDTR